MRRSNRFIVYFLIGFIAYYIFSNGDDFGYQEESEWLLPLLIVVLVLLLGIRFWQKGKKE